MQNSITQWLKEMKQWSTDATDMTYHNLKRSCNMNKDVWALQCDGILFKEI